MFKVQENGDGSTSIFCKKSGAFICKLNKQRENMGLAGRPRPVNVVGPSPQPRLSLNNLEIKSGNQSDAEEKKESKIKCFPPLPKEVKEDYYDDCITPEEFARVLNLVPTKKFKETPLEQLNSTFPLRHHPRTKPAQISEEISDLKSQDDLPLTSAFGIKLLKLNPVKYFYNDQTIAQKIKNYNSYCRYMLNTQHLCNNFPKLRCREKKEYPVPGSKFSKICYWHTYAFNKKQKLEKIITFKTGLNKRSRKLLQKCDKKLTVHCKRLTSEEIQVWLAKKSGVIKPITSDCIRGEDSTSAPPTLIDIASDSSESDSEDSSSASNTSSTDDSDYAPRILSFKGVLNRPNHILSVPAINRVVPSKPFKSSYSRGNWCVRLSNVLNRIRRFGDNYYVSGTRIRIPFLGQYLSTLNSNFRKVNQVLNPSAAASSSSAVLQYDHAYHLPVPMPPALRKKLLTHSLMSSNSPKSKKKVVSRSFSTADNFRNKMRSPLHVNTVNVQTPVNSSPVKNLQIIPIIDLTGSPPKTQNTPPKVHNKLVPNWIFHCYGCKHKKGFYVEADVKVYGTEHMRKYHCVSDPQLFLTLKRSSCGGMLEAFPGYKESCK